MKAMFRKSSMIYNNQNRFAAPKPSNLPAPGNQSSAPQKHILKIKKKSFHNTQG